MFDSQSSQEFYSQSLIKMNNLLPNIETVSSTGSDYWSQSSSQEETLRSYAKRPLLFSRREKPIINGHEKNMQFHDMQQNRLAEMNQKMLLSMIETLTNKQIVEVKNSLDTFQSGMLCKLQASLQEVKSSISESDRFSKVLTLLEDFKVYLGPIDQLKMELQKKENEVNVKNETIHHLNAQLHQMKQELKIHYEKDSITRNKRAERLDELLDTNQSFIKTLEDLKENGKEFKININHLLKESMSMSEQNGMLLSKENMHYGELADIRRQIDGLSRTLPEVCRNLENIIQFNHYQKRSNNYAVPASNDIHTSSNQNSNLHFNIQPSSMEPMHLYQQNPRTFLSPKPLQSRFAVTAHTYVRPSPTAVVAPRVVEKVVEIKNEFEPQNVVNHQVKRKPVVTHNDIFEVSASESECEQDGSDIVRNLKRNTNTNIYNNSTRKITNKRNSSKESQQKKPKNQSKKSPLKTHNDKTKDTSSKPSTPVQRSIKRYCKIKKAVNPFAALPSNSKVGGTFRNNNQGLLRPSRCSLAMKRKQENVFNFDGDDDELIQLADLLKSKCQKRSIQMTS